MILIDAHNIVNGGGLTLLNYFVRTLEERDIPFRLIKRAKVEVTGNPAHIISCPSPLRRGSILENVFRQSKSNTLFCLGNYPPPKKYDIPTVTYLHNPYLVGKWRHHVHTDVLLPFRQAYIHRYLRNTDFVVFQNDHIRTQFFHLYGQPERVSYLKLPFFDESKIQEIRSLHLEKKERFIYVSLPHVHKNHTYLLEVWNELLKQRHTPELFLTIPRTASNQKLLTEIDRINALGGKIVNRGEVAYEEALRETARSSYCIYPSLLETFGLGLVEASLLNCKVLAASLPYTDEILKPSLLFNPYDIPSGVDAVLKAIHSGHTLPDSLHTIQNQIENVIHLLLDRKPKYNHN